ATGAASFAANSGANTFHSSADVNYFPLDLTNAAADATIKIEPVGLGVQPAAAVFTRSGPQAAWQTLDSDAQNGIGTLHVSAAPGKNLTDGDYLLAVAPKGFDTPARDYQVEITTTTLGPGALDQGQRDGAVQLLTLPVAPGKAGVTQSGQLGVPDTI